MKAVSLFPGGIQTRKCRKNNVPTTTSDTVPDDKMFKYRKIECFLQRIESAGEKWPNKQFNCGIPTGPKPIIRFAICSDRLTKIPRGMAVSPPLPLTSLPKNII